MFEYLLTSQAPTFQQLCSKIAGRDAAMDAMVAISKDMSLYRQAVGPEKLWYWALCQACGDPLEPQMFLAQYHQVLIEYFDKEALTVKKLVNNADRLALLLHAMLDAGEVAVTDSNRLRQLVPLRNDLSTILNSATKTLANTVKYADSKQLFGAPVATGKVEAGQTVPWRTADCRYVNNEIYVDLVETVNATLRQKGSSLTLINGSLSGKIDVKCYLSGNPTVQLKLRTSGHPLDNSALHRCVELGEAGVATMNFVPPDGRFTLAEYAIDLSAISQAARRLTNLGLVTVSLASGLGQHRDEFEIKVIIGNSTQVAAIEDLRITVYFPDISDAAKIKILRTTHGGWESDLSRVRGVWAFDKQTAVGSVPVLRGCVENPESTPHAPPVFPSHLAVSYSHVGQLPSGIRVDTIALSDLPPGSKPFKGVKYTSRAGDYIVRA